MKIPVWSMLTALAISGATYSIAVLAESGDDVGPASASVAPQRPLDNIARYRVTYVKSDATTVIRSATVVSITNNSPTTCDTLVEWGTGFGEHVCTTKFTLGHGRTGNQCSRDIPSDIATCNAACSSTLTFEGNAVVDSTNLTPCANIAVSARTYYTSGSTDDAVTAATDAKIVRINQGNRGD
jgi:hypothetical protein